ncbi:DEAD/DEAH box helicase [Pyrobaculum neutrophilum]|uniref:Type III restriction protein res subunit n=1 Tax=Pyrobaculum neutrophilum (strain DSM 2338 / JCM 9278 / NBRC 100436 / V24Sta) TaxID=444157 RepID=B1Y8P0_PYRNV|nr:DEAD/DEAH box helicase family protein [Pyrobaculum neutrophilum]ACB40119.1 type III restriction protein res subunit [Pyrobaculum neutrophilum V24Sta]
MGLTLLWDRGTILLEGQLPEELRRLSFVKLDPRVGRYRALAIYYQRILAAAKAAGAEVEDRVWAPQCREVRPAAEVKLRSYQREALAAWMRTKRGVVVMPTGAGKTHVAIAAIAELGEPALVVVPTVELVQQWRTRLSHYFPGRVGVWYGEEKRESCVTVITYDSAYAAVETIGNRFRLLVFDEVHHLPSQSYRQIAELSPAPYRMGLTATPERADGLHVDLDWLVGPVVYRLSAAEVRGLWTADYEVEVVKVQLREEERALYKELERRYLAYLRKRGLRFRSPSDFQKLVVLAGRDPEARRALAAWHGMRRLIFETEAKVDAVGDILAKHRDSKVIIFTEYTSLARAVSERYLIPLVAHDTTPYERELVMSAFRRGEFKAIVTGKVLDEGVDVPDVDVVVILGGTSSTRQFIQRMGRALRLKPHKAKIYEVVTASTREVGAARRRKRGLA